jgi:hypothetical protein
MIGVSSLSSASGLAVITAATQSQAANSAVGSQGASSGSPSQPQPASSSDFSIGVTLSYKGITQSIVNNQLDQGSLGNTDQSLVSAVTGYENTRIQNNNLSSQQISDDLYSGAGIPTIGGSAAGGDAMDTIASQTKLLQEQATGVSAIISQQTQWLAQGRPADNNLNVDAKTFQNMTDDQMAGFMASEQDTVNLDTSKATAITQALGNGTLSIEKATDVQGLDYSETDSYSVNGNTGSGSLSVSENQSFLQQDADGKQHALMTIGGVPLYLSWDQSE